MGGIFIQNLVLEMAGARSTPASSFPAKPSSKGDGWPLTGRRTAPSSRTITIRSTCFRGGARHFRPAHRQPNGSSEGPKGARRLKPERRPSRAGRATINLHRVAPVTQPAEALGGDEFRYQQSQICPRPPPPQLSALSGEVCFEALFRRAELNINNKSSGRGRGKHSIGASGFKCEP